MKPIFKGKMRIHFNKKTKTNLVWSLITSKGCFHVKGLVIDRPPITTEFKGHMAKQPKATFVVFGDLYINKQGYGVII